MSIFKKIFLFSSLFLLLTLGSRVNAMTPTATFTIDPNNSSLVQVNVSGDANSSVLFKYFSDTGLQLGSLGRTNSSGAFSGSINISDYKVSSNTVVAVMINGQTSTDSAWTFSTNSSNTNLTLSQSSVVVNAGQSTTVTTSLNGTNSLYLSSNSNPQIANVSFNGNQITVSGITVGQTATNICVANSSASTNCASLYIVVQNTSNQALTFSQSNTSIISGQNVQINITGGNGFYQVQNNSNPNTISTSLNGPVLTLYANGSTGSSTITICTTNLASCGIVNASIGTYNSSGTGLSFSQTYPTVTVGQTSVINISGGYGTYYISSNSNSSNVQTYLSTSTVTLYGNNPGNSSITICAPSGSCGTITATIVATSGGTLTLSQKNLTLSTGQVSSVVITGGTVPYSLIQSNDGVAQYSLNGNAVTVTAIRNGLSSTTVCSAAGGCIVLNVTINSATGSVSGVQPTFSQNNVSINTAQTTSVYMTGNGGYYISNNSNQNVLSASVSGSSLVLTGVSIGSTNISVCQTGGQCNTIYVTVSNSVSSTNTTPITFDKTYVILKVGENSTVNVSGGSGSGYYVSNSTTNDLVSSYMNGSVLSVTGKAAGFGTVSVCSATNTCATLSYYVSGTATTNPVVTTSTKYKFLKPLKFGMTNSDVTELQKRLKAEGIYSGPITGYYGNLTVTAVKKFQKINKLEQLGSVGPGTRSLLNK